VVADIGNVGAVDLTRIRAVAFDCYGTLIDFDERAFSVAVHDLLETHGIDHVHGEAVWAKWMDSARDYAKHHGRDPEAPIDGCEPAFERFAEVWPHHFQHAFDATGVDTIGTDTAMTHLFALLSKAPAYVEVEEVLPALRRAGFTVAVASNADDAHLYPVLQNAGIDVDMVVTSESVRSYKPRRPFFDSLCDRLGMAREEILFVGDSPFSDVRGAHNAGLPVYWVRRYEDAEQRKYLKQGPDWTYPDLRGLCAILLGTGE
jgi:2-haloalkanoic acid dehalogenase type II